MRLYYILLVFIITLFVVGCSDDPEKPLPEKTEALNMLYGKWRYDCFLDGQTKRHGMGDFYEDYQEEYLADSTYKLIKTIYYNSSDCSANAVVRETFTGTYNIHDSFEATFRDNATRTAKTWKIDYNYDDILIEGNGLLAKATLSTKRVGPYYGIISIANNTYYDASRAEEEINRPSELRDTYNRTDVIKIMDLDASPSYDLPQAVANLVGNWDDDCFNDGDTDTTGNYQQQSNINIQAGNVVQIKQSIWDSSNCTQNEIASITITGTYKIVSNQETSISKVNAAVVEMTFTAGSAVYTGSKEAALISIDYEPYTDGLPYYFLMYVDVTYDLLVYGGWFEVAVEALPSEFEWNATRI